MLTESVLRFSRSQAGPSPLRFERRDVGAELRDAVAFFSLTASAADVTLHVDADADLWADVDPGALRQILLNVLDNAVKYGPRGQAVSAAARRAGTDALVVITDQGPGVPPADRQRVFDAYVRLDRAGVPNVAGTGIGLSVVQDLVTAHRGTVAFQDAADGGTGAIVCVRLPLAPAPARPAAEKRVDAAAGSHAS